MTTTTGATQQIVTAYEDNNLSPEQIAEAFDNEFDVVAIKATLMQFSGKYRSLSNTVPEKKAVGFSEEQEEAAVRTIATLMEYSEDEHVRAKLAIFVREDRQGRRDSVTKLANAGGANIMQFQIFLNKANESLKFTEQKAIDIKSAKIP